MAHASSHQEDRALALSTVEAELQPQESTSESASVKTHSTLTAEMGSLFAFKTRQPEVRHTYHRQPALLTVVFGLL